MSVHAVDHNQARAHWDELLEQAVHGEEVVITRAGLPVAKIIPIPQTIEPRQFGIAHGLITIRDDFDAPLEDLREYT